MGSWNISLTLNLDNVVSRIQTYVSLKNPTARNVRSFMDWIQDHKPLTKEESKFLEHKDDFVALSDGQENGWLDGLVEDTLNFCLPDNLMRVRYHIFLTYLRSPQPPQLRLTHPRNSLLHQHYPTARTTITSASAADAASTWSCVLFLSSQPWAYWSGHQRCCSSSRAKVR